MPLFKNSWFYLLITILHSLSLCVGGLFLCFACIFTVIFSCNLKQQPLLFSSYSKAAFGASEWFTYCPKPIVFFFLKEPITLMDHSLVELKENMSHAVWGHPRWTGHGGELWQNVVHWRREWPSVFLPWETMNSMKRQKDRILKEELPVGRCPICYWRTVEK